MNNAVTLEEIEQQFLDAAQHAGSKTSFKLLRAELGIAEDACVAEPNFQNTLTAADLRRRVARAHRALFRVVE